MTRLTLKLGRKVLEVVDAGLCVGKGRPEPGRMCVEAAVCYAAGEPHGDNPECVSQIVRDVKVRLNDSPWSSNAERAKGLRRIAVAQLGSASAKFDERKFAVAFSKKALALADTVPAPSVDVREYRRYLMETLKDRDFRPDTVAAEASVLYRCVLFDLGVTDALLTEWANMVEDCLRAAGSPGVELLDKILGKRVDD